MSKLWNGGLLKAKGKHSFIILNSNRSTHAAVTDTLCYTTAVSVPLKSGCAYAHSDQELHSPHMR